MLMRRLYTEADEGVPSSRMPSTPDSSLAVPNSTLSGSAAQCSQQEAERHAAAHQGSEEQGAEQHPQTQQQPVQSRPEQGGTESGIGAGAAQSIVASPVKALIHLPDSPEAAVGSRLLSHSVFALLCHPVCDLYCLLQDTQARIAAKASLRWGLEQVRLAAPSMLPVQICSIYDTCKQCPLAAGHVPASMMVCCKVAEFILNI